MPDALPPLTDAELANLEHWNAIATPGPWGWLDGSLMGTPHGVWVDLCDDTLDGLFVIKMRNALPRLLKELRQLRTETGPLGKSKMVSDG